MQHHSFSPKALVRSFLQHRHLIAILVRREVVGRYRGSFLGLLWSLFNPVLMLAVYTFVFSIVFKARWNVESESKSEFALILFAGLLVFNIFAECINRAPGLILGNVNYVKKVVFPLEILPWVSLGSALFHATISFGVWLAAYLLLNGLPPATALFIPLILLPLILFTMGLSWVLTSLGVYLRDITQFVGIMTTILLFVSPIFYPVTAIPETFRAILLFNPLMPILEDTRNVLFWGIMPNGSILSAYLLVGAFTAWLGFAWFQKTRKGFADVL